MSKTEHLWLFNTIHPDSIAALNLLYVLIIPKTKTEMNVAF